MAQETNRALSQPRGVGWRGRWEGGSKGRGYIYTYGWFSLEGMMLKLKLQYFGHLMRTVDSLEKTLMLGGLGAGGEGDDRGWDGWMASLTRWTWIWVNSWSWWWTGRPGVLRFMGSQRVGHDWATELNWTELMADSCWGLTGNNKIL